MAQRQENIDLEGQVWERDRNRNKDISERQMRQRTENGRSTDLRDTNGGI
jgi:hypothetical protein